jgi:hypothetical protein
MKALDLMAEVDEQHRLQAALPEDAPPGPVRVISDATGAETPEAIAAEWEKLRQMIRECAVDTGIGDLAHQHDHYLYGKPKRA